MFFAVVLPSKSIVIRHSSLQCNTVQPECLQVQLAMQLKALSDLVQILAFIWQALQLALEGQASGSAGTNPSMALLAASGESVFSSDATIITIYDIYKFFLSQYWPNLC